jgi:hypothetical protein
MTDRCKLLLYWGLLLLSSAGIFWLLLPAKPLGFSIHDAVRVVAALIVTFAWFAGWRL